MTMVMTVIITRVMTVIITMVMSMVMFNPNRSQRICLEIVLNFGDSLGIRWGFLRDSGYFRGIRMFLALQIMGDSPAELVPFIILKRSRRMRSGAVATGRRRPRLFLEFYGPVSF